MLDFLQCQFTLKLLSNQNTYVSVSNFSCSIKLYPSFCNYSFSKFPSWHETCMLGWWKIQILQQWKVLRIFTHVNTYPRRILVSNFSWCSINLNHLTFLFRAVFSKAICGTNNPRECSKLQGVFNYMYNFK